MNNEQSEIEQTEKGITSYQDETEKLEILESKLIIWKKKEAAI